MKKVISLVLFIGALSLTTDTSKACTRAYPFSLDELFEADAIVRVTALKYIVAPEPHILTTRIPDSTIEFRVEEILKGKNIPKALTINGYLSDKDDFNEVAFPYKFVRPNGRHGSCFANTYKGGAQFLLFLKKKDSGYAPYWDALAPTNEQLHHDSDSWVEWAKIRLNPCAKLETQDVDLEPLSKYELYRHMTEQSRGLRAYKAARCYIQRFQQDDDEFIRYIRKWVVAFDKGQKKNA